MIETISIQWELFNISLYSNKERRGSRSSLRLFTQTFEDMADSRQNQNIFVR